VKASAIPAAQAIAEGFGYCHGGKGSIGKMIDAIAAGKLIVTQGKE
jgi:hypothetical protein